MRILNAIVKNESKVIERCFNSLKELIDGLVISDTGSTDNTVEIMENWRVKNNKLGKIVSHEWKNFEHNRNMALQSCISWIQENKDENIDKSDKDDYIIFIDADDYLEIIDLESIKQQLSNLTKEKYMVTMKCGSLDYARLFCIKVPKKHEKVTCKWEGVLHEYMNRDGESGQLTGAYIQASREGARSADPMKYLKDALVLETALKENANNDRYVFYLAQSYRDYGGNEFAKMAEKLYMKRYNMGGWDEERYISLVEAAKCRINRGKSDDKAANLLSQALCLRPHRFEAPYYLIRYYRMKNLHHIGYLLGKSMFSLPYPSDLLFVDKAIHTWGFYDEIAICCTWAKDKKLYRYLCEKILAIPNLPKDTRKRISRDLKTFG